MLVIEVPSDKVKEKMAHGMVAYSCRSARRAARFLLLAAAPLVPGGAAAASSALPGLPPRPIKRMLVWEESLVVLANDTNLWRQPVESKAPAWERVRLLPGEVRDVAGGGGWLCALGSASTVVCTQGESGKEKVLPVPSGSWRIALGGEALWVITVAPPAASIRREVCRFPMAGGSGECRPLEFQLTPEEIRDEGKATGLEKNLFDTALLVAGGDHAFVVYEFRDLIVRCDRGLFCHGIRWTSPLTEIQEVEVALQKRHGAHFRIPRHRAADAAALPGGGLVVLPAITHVDAQAETFRQRDMLYRFSLQGELVEKRDLGRRVLAIAGQGPDLLVLGERLMPERIALEAQATPATPKKP